MSLIVVGIDEAGYGPMLGPLTVGMSAFRVDAWEPGRPAPDLWDRLSLGVCKKPEPSRLAVDDSKKLKLANDSKRHPLTHLEAGVLAFLRTIGHTPSTDAELFNALGVRRERHAWYAGEAVPVPVAHEPDHLAVRSNALVRAMIGSGVECLDLRVASVGESAFNETVRKAGSKSAATALAIGKHLQHVWESWSLVGSAHPEGGPRVVCDRQGGRTEYAGMLFRMMGEIPRARDVEVVELERTDARSRYCVRGRDNLDQRREMTVLFQTEAEGEHLPVALASMGAKLVRELMMARFNRYWQARARAAGIVELRPTAGYTTDARRWLGDAAALLSSEERRTLVRIA